MVTPVYLEPQSDEPVSLFQRLRELSLYAHVDIATRPANETLKRVRLLQHKFDQFCPGCGQGSTFESVVSEELQLATRRDRLASAATSGSGTGGSLTAWTGEFELRVVCMRAGHPAVYYFHTIGPSAQQLVAVANDKTAAVTATRVVKVGQHPSITDFQIGDLTAFQEGMSRRQRGEFVRAVNCSAHGLHVAACVYFRRVFEDVLGEARDAYMKEHGQTEWPEFRAAQTTDQRIALLKGHVPEFMSSHPHLYRILSVGVHELTEEQCGREMPVLRKAIELMMEDRVLEARRKKQREDVSKMLSQSVNRVQERS